MSLENYITKLFRDKEKNGYKTIYIMVDVHNTILRSRYDKVEIFECFNMAKETLQLLSQQNDIKLILWTSSYPDKAQMYVDFFKTNGIIFDFINENPEYRNLEYACFDSKPYYDIGIDDKFGFDAETDWEILYNIFQKIFGR